MRTCGKCGQPRSDSDFYVRTNGKANPWCKSCYRSWYVARAGGTVERRCDNCGAAMQVTARRAAEPNVFCSRECKQAERKAKAKASRIASKEPRPCLHCGAVIGAERRTDARYCSKECNSAAHAVTRKMSKRADRKRPEVLVSRNYLGDRDGWRCKLCGKKVDRALKHPDPLSPSIDHVVPLSAGGDNELSNLQLAHLRCNLSKSARAQGEQLMAFG